MGVLSSLYTGVSGLAAQGEALGVIGDNIANANTVGFKASRAEFQDIVSKSLKGILGGNQVGRGVKIGAVNPLLVQGNVDATEKSTDLAIAGDGLIAPDQIPTPNGVIRLAAPSSIEEYARVLYAALRSADQKGLDTVVVLQPGGDGLAAAIRDRLQRSVTK